MIAVGTLCLLINGHELEGKVCTVVGPLENCHIIDSKGLDCYGDVYDIETEVPIPFGYSGWAARPSELLPITPPSAPVSHETMAAEPA